MALGGTNTALYSNDGSNMSTGSAHSDHSDRGRDNLLEPSPEKQMIHPVTTARTPTERKRKRKNIVSTSSSEGVDNVTPKRGAAPTPGGANNETNRKINEFFSKHPPSSPVRQGSAASAAGGGKSPSQFPGMYPPSPKAQYVVNSPNPNLGSLPSEYTTLMQPPTQRQMSASFRVQSAQTDMTIHDIRQLESHSISQIESKDNRIDELGRMNDELGRQLAQVQTVVDQQKSTVQKCLNVVKELLIEKSTIERKDARSKCMQNRLRLGQFVTQRVGATFQENWTDGYAFQVSTVRVFIVHGRVT